MEKMKIIGTMLISAHLNGVIFSNIQVNMICLCGCIPNTLVHTHFVNMGSQSVLFVPTVVFMGGHMGSPCTNLYFDLVKPKTTTVD
jgi:hypothetical protein